MLRIWRLSRTKIGLVYKSYKRRKKNTTLNTIPFIYLYNGEFFVYFFLLLNAFDLLYKNHLFLSIVYFIINSRSTKQIAFVEIKGGLIFGY